MRRILWLFNFLRYAYSRHASWRVFYDDVGRRTYPLRYDTAQTLARMYAPARVEYCRDWKGDLL